MPLRDIRAQGQNLSRKKKDCRLAGDNKLWYNGDNRQAMRQEQTSMSVNGLNTSYSALLANQFRLDVTANNVANVNTDGFQASTVQTADNAYVNDIGTGTRVTGSYAPPRPGPMAVNTSQAAGEAGLTELSNTDLVTEMTNMMAARQAYSANTVMGVATDEATQTLLDIKS